MRTRIPFSSCSIFTWSALIGEAVRVPWAEAAAERPRVHRERRMQVRIAEERARREAAYG